MSPSHIERAFEEQIEDHLIAKGGYHRSDAREFDRARAIFPAEIAPFIKATQVKEWQQLERLHGSNTGSVILNDLVKALDMRGSLATLRHGFKCFGKLIRMAYFKPATKLNEETERLYAENRLTVTRQVHYSTRDEKSLDMVLSVNGIPVATAELKNPYTGQDIEDAMAQYKMTRDPAEPIFRFKQRALVHFAVDADLVFMATKLESDKTFFLPFNKGYQNGAGNPPNPNGHKTAYLWEEVWQRDSWLDILSRFLHLDRDEKEKRETLIFPRYHQLQVVRTLEADARAAGPGKNYLIQHSAGSGKSNSIAWLAHRLSSLHDEQDRKVFDSVVVITDRIVLDRQLQDTIYQFEHKQGVVQKIDEDSTQLAEALNTGTPIIITTLQKFPFVRKKTEELKSGRYAVIVDEAHSSQSGEAAAELKGVLAKDNIAKQAGEAMEEHGFSEDWQDAMLREMAKRAQQPNLSFFAFTATPKAKTLKAFGSVGEDGKPHPFHLYSMRQAIEEGFILNVLANYTTYKAYYKLIKSAEEDPQVQKRAATRALARFLNFNEHHIASKVDVMIEHFWRHTRHKISGQAKAMVVTGGRLEAYQYYRAFQRAVEVKGYEIGLLVAFSGEIVDPDTQDKWTEPKLNGFKESELAEKFDGSEYRILLVADKYQTGFDQPRLHTMYVNKRLDGIQAIQTLSRLNRTAKGKEDTFVLDFVNDADDIRQAFQPYFEDTTIGEDADVHQLYQLQHDLAERQVFYAQEVDQLCEVFFRARVALTKTDNGLLYSIVDKAVPRFKALGEDEQEEFRGKVGAFRRLYGFLSQVIPFQDTDLEKLFTYLRFLEARLPESGGPAYDFGEDVLLKYYRLQKISEGRISLDAGNAGELRGPTAVGTGRAQSPEVDLSTVIDLVNERFGTTFTKSDELVFEQAKQDAKADADLQQASTVNEIDTWKFLYDRKFEDLLIERLQRNPQIVSWALSDPERLKMIRDLYAAEVYDACRRTAGSELAAPKPLPSV
jgi:type I restriction enzyme, R subunit